MVEVNAEEPESNRAIRLAQEVQRAQNNHQQPQNEGNHDDALNEDEVLNRVMLVQRHLPFDIFDPDSDSDDEYNDDDDSNSGDGGDEVDDDSDDEDPDDLPPLVHLNDIDDDFSLGDFFFAGAHRGRHGFGGIGFFDLFGELMQQRNQEMMTSRMEVYLKQVRDQDPALESVDITLSHHLCVALIRAMHKNKVVDTLSVDLNDGAAPHILDELLKLLKVNRKIHRLELGDFEKLTSINQLLERIVAETKKTQFRPHFTELVVRLFVPAASEQPTKASVLRLFELLAQLPNVSTLELEVDLADIVVSQVHDEFVAMLKQSENILVVKFDGTEEDHKESCVQLQEEAEKICRFRREVECEKLLKKTSQGSLALWPNILSKLATGQENYSSVFGLMKEMNGNLIPSSS
mmetsp:Transcript_26735/g.39072  ORF Transcript_26735/g.39072 Transcript_26735/m.39072 type:complete len:405 (-) Transcript_26735:174-1388(-)